LTVSSISVSLPDWNTVYYWRATSVFENNNRGTSAAWTFKTKFVPVNLISPLNGTVCGDSLTEFKWNKADAEFYTLQVSELEDFSNIIFEKSNIIDTAFKVKLPKYSTKYYWRVASRKSTCLTEFSEIWDITTKQAPPELLLPANGTFGGQLFDTENFEVTFVWKKSNVDDTYNFQLSDSSNFANIIAEVASTSDTNFTVVLDPDFNKTYYWRASTTSNGCVSYWSNVNKFKTPYPSPNLAEPMENETCVTMNNTNFKWSALTGVSKYRLQVSDTNSFSRILIDTANITEREINLMLTNHLTIHYWRVRGEDSQNSGLWSATNNFITTQRVPEIISPSDNSIGLNKNIGFNWEDFGPLALYDLKVYADENMEVVLLDTMGLDTNYFMFTVPNDNYTYYWQVRTKDINCIGDWTNLKIFKTQIPAPVLSLPENLAVEVTLNPIFKWLAVEEADNYDIEVSTDSLFKTKFVSDFAVPSIEWTQPAVKFAETTKYFWRVRARNSDGVSLWSLPFSFTTEESPAGMTTLISPINNSLKISMDAELKWSTADKAIKYEVTVATDNEFKNIFVTQETPDTTLQVVGLERFTEYWWRVRTISANNKGKISGEFKFRTKDIAPDGIVSLISPENNIDETPLFMNFAWSSIERAIAYHFQLALSSDFAENTIKENQPAIKDTTLLVGGLELNKTYYWRVAAFNEDGKAEWSTVRQFKTIINTSVKDVDLNISSHSVFPNPSSGSFTLNVNLQNNSKGKLKIVNIAGEELYKIENIELNTGENNIHLNLNSYVNGIYFYSLETSSGTTTGKIIIE
jgi:hypothetical protein